MDLIVEQIHERLCQNHKMLISNRLIQSQNYETVRLRDIYLGENGHCAVHYSDFKVFTGFILAALIALKLTVKIVTNKQPKPTKIKIGHSMVVRYSNCRSQLFT